MPTPNEILDEKELSRWQKRRWRELKRALIKQEVADYLACIRRLMNENGGKLPSKEYIALFRIYKIPQGCEFAVQHFIRFPDATDNELCKLIRPPISYISFTEKLVGPSPEPALDFKRWLESRSELLERNGYDLFTAVDGLYLHVEPFTTKDEIIDFIREYFDKELKPLLSESGNPFIPESIRKKGRITSIRKSEEIDEAIIKLSAEGKTPKEIAESLSGNHEPSNIRSRKSKLKKQDRLHNI